MAEHESEKRKIFITITLYILLAFAFFSEYWGATSVGALIFILGILTLIPLTIIYINKKKTIWAWFCMIPFILFLLFNLTLLYKKGWDWIGMFVKIINMESLTAILFLMVIFLMIFLVVIMIKIKNRKF